MEKKAESTRGAQGGVFISRGEEKNLGQSRGGGGGTFFEPQPGRSRLKTLLPPARARSGGGGGGEGIYSQDRMEKDTGTK